MDKTEFLNKCETYIGQEVDRLKASVIELFDSLKTGLTDDIHTLVTSLVKSEVESVVGAMQAAGQISAVSPDALSFSPDTHASLTRLVRDASIYNYNSDYAHDVAARSSYVTVKHLRSKTTSPICDPTRDAVSRFIHALVILFPTSLSYSPMARANHVCWSPSPPHKQQQQLHAPYAAAPTIPKQS